MAFKLPSNESLLKLAGAHIGNYERKAGSPFAVISECVKYSHIWQSIKMKTEAAGESTPILTQQERDEIIDAVCCGDYDHLLKEEELF